MSVWFECYGPGCVAARNRAVNVRIATERAKTNDNMLIQLDTSKNLAFW